MSIVSSALGGGSTGLTESEVDARVVAITSGVKRITWRPEADLRLHATFPPASANIVLSAAGFDTTARVFSFDDSADEITGVPWVVPLNWNEGTFRFRAIWTPAGTSTGAVIWNFRHSFAGDQETVSISTSAQNSVDTGGGVALNLQISPWSDPITVASLAIGDVIFWQIMRNGSNGSDTLVGDAHLIAVEFEFSTDYPTDDAA